MRNSILLFILTTLATVAYSQTLIKHVSSSSNTKGHITTINNKATDNKPDAILIVTQNYGVYNVNEIGVWYDGGRWKIFNQNRKAMPKNNQFNILVLGKSTKSFTHKTTKSNTSGHITTLNLKTTYKKSNELVFVTQNYGKYNTSVVGVWYDGGKWKIYNEDRKPMPIGTKFNVFVVNEGKVNFKQIKGITFKHSNQSKGHISWIDYLDSKNNYPLQLFITQNYIGQYNPHATGVWYAKGKWTAYNQDRETMKKGVRFNVLAVKSIKKITNGKDYNQAGKDIISAAEINVTDKPAVGSIPISNRPTTIQTYAKQNESIVGSSIGNIRNISDGGKYQYFTNGVIYQHTGKGTLGFIPKGPILETWWQSGFEHGYFGYPTSASESGIQLNSIPFEGGRISTAGSGVPFSILTYNTQLITIAYKGRGRSNQLNRLIEVIKADSPDFICLNEVFHDGERDKIVAELRSTHPHRVDAPDESDITRGGVLEDGGLLLLSKHPIIQSDELIFRVNEGVDHLANKGVICATVAVNGDPNNLLDIYVTHLQAKSPNIAKTQAKIGASFIASRSLKKIPALFVGDFNLNFNSGNSYDYYKSLNYPFDAWYYANFFNRGNDKGITRDNERKYESGSLPMSDSRRGINGIRIDAILKYPAYSASFSVGDVQVKRYELNHNSGIDLSDHYGLMYKGNLQKVRTHFNQNLKIREITFHLSKLHCLQKTSGTGDDQIRIQFRAGINNNRQKGSNPVELGDMGDGDKKSISNRSLTFRSSDQNGITKINCSVKVEEIDWGSGDDLIGDVTLLLSREELLLSAKHNMSDSRYNARHPIAVPLMRSDGSRYVAYLTYDLKTD